MNYLFIPILFSVSFFRYCFPFGRPEGALKATLSLLERVIKNSVAYPHRNKIAFAYSDKIIKGCCFFWSINYSNYIKCYHYFEQAVKYSE